MTNAPPPHNLLRGGVQTQRRIPRLGKYAAQALSPQRLTWVLKLGKNPDICQATGRQAARRLGSFLKRASLSNSLRGPENPRGHLEKAAGGQGYRTLTYLGEGGLARKNGLYQLVLPKKQVLVEIAKSFRFLRHVFQSVSA